MEQNTYRLDRIVQDPGNRILCYLQAGPDRPFVREELMHISQDTQVPPDKWVNGSSHASFFISVVQIQKNFLTKEK